MRRILSAVLECVEPNKNIVKIVPNGTAIQNARTSYVGDTLTRDGYHLSLQLGRYIAGLTFFHALTGRSIENISYRPEGITTALYKLAIESATNAVKEPWDVTESQYSEEPAIDFSQYEKLELNWTPLGYWNSTDRGSYNVIISDGSSLSKQFYASARFTEEDIPVGSIIVVAEGWKYRPEAWEDEGRLTSTRPGNVTEQTVEVTATWWSKYEYRAFNLSRTDGSSLEGVSLEEIQNAFTVYVPKKN